MNLARAIPVAFALACSTAAPADNISMVHDSDPQMNAAIVRARQTLPGFFLLKSKGLEGTSGFILKVKFSRGGNHEHMWVSPFRQDGKGGFQGLLKSEPRFLFELKWGQEVTFAQDQITDWGYTRSGKRIGFFTTCVLLAKDPTLRARVKEQGLEYECAA